MAATRYAYCKNVHNKEKVGWNYK
ncbi:putative pyrophosphate-dependent phosphofructokinase domain protein, partial [Chlamydia psittaci 84-8471/1]